jgi:hypothetical protein
MPIFRVLHPDADALVVFDNSSNHRAFAPDALLAHRLNLKNGGKNCPKLRATTFVRGGELLTQVMQLPDGTPKGLKLILQERGLWPMDDSLDREGAMKLLAEQPDFKAQKDHLTETLESSGGGFRALFLPKFHPELNFIEFYWAAAKRYARANCDYKFDSLRATVPKALASVTLVELRNAARHCFRYMSAYAGRDGFTLSPKQVERAVKLHKSQVPSNHPSFLLQGERHCNARVSHTQQRKFIKQQCYSVALEPASVTACRPQRAAANEHGIIFHSTPAAGQLERVERPAQPETRADIKIVVTPWIF